MAAALLLPDLRLSWQTECSRQDRVHEQPRGQRRDLRDERGRERRHRLTDNPASDQQPAWSPDGGKFVFVNNRDEMKRIYVMNTDGTGVTQLTDKAYCRQRRAS